MSLGRKWPSVRCGRILGILMAMAVVCASLSSQARGAEGEVARVAPVGPVFLQSWDGAPYLLVNELLNEGRLPHLRELRKQSLWSEGVVPAFPSKTAPGHARIWTGAPEKVNGITSNSVLYLDRKHRSIIEARRGFYGDALRAEPIWFTAARQGRRVLVWNAPQAWPEPEWMAESGGDGSWRQRLEVVYGYTRDWFGSGVLDVTQVGSDGLELKLGAWKGRFFPGELGRIEVRGSGRRWSRGLSTGMGSGSHLSSAILLPEDSPLFFRLYSLSSDRQVLYHTSAAPVEGTVGLFPGIVAAGGGFIENGPSELYESGGFGATLMEGGEGRAEEIYIDAIRDLVRLNLRSMEVLLAEGGRDLLVNYLPFPDEALHVWYGYLDPDLSAYDPVLAAKVRPVVEEVLEILDWHLGEILEKLPPDSPFFLVSDHGMDGCDRVFLVNRLLSQRGFLVLDSAGKVDLSRTRALYGPGNTASIVLNTTDWKGGIVAAEELPELLDQLSETLSQAVDPRDGKRLVRRVYRVSEGDNEFGGPTAGQLYIDAAPGVNLGSSKMPGPFVERRAPGGHHHFRAFDDPRMLGILYARLPGRKGGQPGALSQLAIAPTICRLLGIEPAPTMTRPPL